MKKFSILEKFKYTDEEIEDFFLDYKDDDKFELKSGFLTSDNRFFTDVAGVKKGTRQCKMATISMEDICKDGIQGPGAGPRSITDFSKIEKVLSEIKKFFSRSGLEPNFIIEPNWEDIEIHFFIVGGLVEDKQLGSKDDILRFQKELLAICKARGYKRVRLGNNWLEIRTPVRDERLWFGIIDMFNRLQNGTLPDNERNAPIIDWYNRLTNAGYTISKSGGDNQIVIKIKPQ